MWDREGPSRYCCTLSVCGAPMIPMASELPWGRGCFSVMVQERLQHPAARAQELLQHSNPRKLPLLLFSLSQMPQQKHILRV